jgi:hypothetical protein
MSTENIGALAAALAKAQAGFTPVKRDKTVTVQKKTGGSYSFKYAPLESVLDAVRQPLADNGLVVLQVLDEGNLVTSLIHESGATLTGSVPIPPGSDIKELGSAITYLRRYALQALLGIAAEDDDDGSRAVGDTSTPVTSGPETLELLGRVDVKGRAVAGGSDSYKGEWRQTPDGWAIGFRLVRGDDKDIPQVLITGDIAMTMYAAGTTPIGQSVHVKGRLYAVKQPGRTTYNRLVVGEAEGHFIETDDWRIPAETPPSEPEPGAEVPAPVAPGQEEAFDLSDTALGVAS